MIAILFAAATLAFLVSAVAGGGAGLVLVPLLRAVVPIAGVPAALSIGTATSSLSRIALFRRSIRWSVVARFIPTALPGAALGAWLLSRFEPAYVELIIACFLLANLPALFRRSTPTRDLEPLSPSAIPAIGAAAGVLSGFTGAVGLLFNSYYRRLGLDRHEIVATRAANEVALHLVKIALYFWFGLLSGPVISAGLVVALAAIASAVIARWLLPRIDEGLFRRIGHGTMVAAGAAMFSLSSTQIARLHDAWLAHVAPGGENEIQLHWNGRRVAAVEWEPEGYPAFERSVSFAALSQPERRAVLAAAPAHRIALIERVATPHERYIEVYWRDAAGGIAKTEVAA